MPVSTVPLVALVLGSPLPEPTGHACCALSNQVTVYCSDSFTKSVSSGSRVPPSALVFCGQSGKGEYVLELDHCACKMTNFSINLSFKQ